MGAFECLSLLCWCPLLACTLSCVWFLLCVACRPGEDVARSHVFGFTWPLLQYLPQLISFFSFVLQNTIQVLFSDSTPPLFSFTKTHSSFAPTRCMRFLWALSLTVSSKRAWVVAPSPIAQTDASVQTPLRPTSPALTSRVMWRPFLPPACMPSRFSCVWLLATTWSVAHRAPLSMGSSRQEYWTGLPCCLTDPGIEPTSLMSPALAGGSLPPASPHPAGRHQIYVHTDWRLPPLQSQLLPDLISFNVVAVLPASQAIRLVVIFN